MVYLHLIFEGDAFGHGDDERDLFLYGFDDSVSCEEGWYEY